MKTLVDGSIKIDTKIDTDGLTKGFQDITTLTKTAAVGIAGALTAAGAGVSTLLGSSIGFESAFAGVIKTVDGTTEQLAVMRTEMINLSKTIPATANEIAAVAEAAGQLGIKTENVTSFTKSMIDLGESTNLTADQAATNLARFANVMQMPQDAFDKLGSTIVALGNTTATTEAEIVNMAMRLAGSGKQIGLTEAQVMSFAAALSSVGIEAESGGTTFSKAMTEIDRAVAKGGDSLDKFAKYSGMSVDQFKTAWGQDASKVLVSFLQGLEDVEKQGGNLNTVLDELGFTELRLTDTLKRASTASDLFATTLETGNKAWVDNTALSKEAGQRYETTASQIEMAKNKLTAIYITLGDKMLPIFNDFLDNTLTPLIEEFDKLSATELGDKFEKLATSFAGLAENVGELVVDGLPAFLDVTSLLVENFDLLAIGIGGLALVDLTTKIIGIGTAFGSLLPVIGGVGTAVIGALGPVGLIVTAVGIGGVAAWNAFSDSQETARQEMLLVGDVLVGLSENLANVNARAADVDNLIVQYRELQQALTDGNIPQAERVELEKQLEAVQQNLIANSGGILTQYDAENGLIDSKLGLLQQNIELERTLAQIKLEQKMSELNPAELQQQVDELAAKQENLVETIKRQSIARAELLAIEKEYAILMEQDPTEERAAALAELTERANEAGTEFGLFSDHILLFGDNSEKAGEQIDENIKSLEKTSDELTSARKSWTEYNNLLTFYNKLNTSDTIKGETAETKKLREAVENVNKVYKDSQAKLADLKIAYEYLKSGQNLAGESVKNLIAKYPELTSLMNANGEITSDNADKVKTFADTQRQMAIEVLKSEKQRLEGIIEVAKASVEATKQEYIAKAKAGMAYYQNMSNLTADTSKSNEEIKAYETAVAGLSAGIAELETTTFKVAAATTDFSDSSSGATGNLKKETAAVKEADDAQKTKMDNMKNLSENLTVALKNNIEQNRDVEIQSIEDVLSAVANGEVEKIDDYQATFLAKTNLVDESKVKEMQALDDVFYKIEEDSYRKISLAEEEYNTRNGLNQTAYDEAIKLIDDEYNYKMGIIASTYGGESEQLKKELEEMRKKREDARAAEAVARADEKIEKERQALALAETEEQIISAKAEVAKAVADKEKLLSDQAYTAREKNLQDRIGLATTEEKEAAKISEKGKKDALDELDDKNKNSVKLLETDLKDTLKITNDKYNKLASADSLAASAKKILISSTEKEIIGILESYNPQYESAGKSAGELLMKGLDDAIHAGKEDLSKTIGDLIELLRVKQEDLGSVTANEPSPTVQRASINNVTNNITTNITQPVASPAATARAVEDTARRLAR